MRIRIEKTKIKKSQKTKKLSIWSAATGFFSQAPMNLLSMF